MTTCWVKYVNILEGRRFFCDKNRIFKRLNSNSPYLAREHGGMCSGKFRRKIRQLGGIK